MTTAPIRRLAKLDLFRTCRERELRKIDSLGTTLDLPAGSTLRRRGEIVTDCIVLLAGRAQGDEGNSTPCMYGPGAVLGTATAHRLPSATTITASTAVIVLIFGPRELRALLEIRPQLREGLNIQTRTEHGHQSPVTAHGRGAHADTSCSENIGAITASPDSFEKLFT